MTKHHADQRLFQAQGRVFMAMVMAVVVVVMVPRLLPA